MPTVLVLSSLVAASRVGGGAQVAAVERMGVETVFIPTVIFGRHPGLGPPGGAATSQDILDGVIGGVEASGALANLDAMIAGYFATADQVAAGARLIDRVRVARPDVRIVVDPIMGDEGTGLYVRQEVAEAIARDLVPRADLITPNAWELARLSGRPVADSASALAAAKSFGAAALVSSIPLGEDIGVLLTSPDGDLLARHPCQADAPKGTGDLLTAVFVGHWLKSGSLSDALAAATADVAAMVAGRPADVRVAAL